MMCSISERKSSPTSTAFERIRDVRCEKSALRAAIEDVAVEANTDEWLVQGELSHGIRQLDLARFFGLRRGEHVRGSPAGGYTGPTMPGATARFPRVGFFDHLRDPEGRGRDVDPAGATIP